MSKRQLRATLRVVRRPDLGDGAKRFEADCRYATSGITHIPGPVGLPDGRLILAVGYLHEERCGRCDVSPVLDRGDQELRALVDEEWLCFQGALLMRGRRN